MSVQVKQVCYFVSYIFNIVYSDFFAAIDIIPYANISTIMSSFMTAQYTWLRGANSSGKNSSTRFSGTSFKT